MSDYRAEMTIDRHRIERRPVGFVLEMLRGRAPDVARIVKGLLRCRIVADVLEDVMGVRARRLLGEPLGTETIGTHTLGVGRGPRTLGLSTLGGRIRGPKVL